MNHVKTCAVLFCILFSCCCVTAGDEASVQSEKPLEAPHFCNLLDLEQDGLQELKDYYKKLRSGGGHSTTYDLGGEEYTYVELIRLLLNETVLAQAMKLSPADADLLLHSHLAWLRYFQKSPSRPSEHEEGSERAIYGAIIDKRRLTARLNAVRLPWEQYKIYAKIANSCYIPMEDGNRKMHFGEVKMIVDAPWGLCKKEADNFGKTIYYYPVELLAETCSLVQSGSSSCYCAVIKEHLDDDSGTSCFFCVWELNGKIRAVHRLGTDDDPVKEIRKVTISGGNAEIEFTTTVPRKSVFDLLAKNKNTLISRDF